MIRHGTRKDDHKKATDQVIDEAYIIQKRKEQGCQDLSDDDQEFLDLLEEAKKFIDPKLLKN